MLSKSGSAVRLDVAGSRGFQEARALAWQPLLVQRREIGPNSTFFATKWSEYEVSNDPRSRRFAPRTGHGADGVLVEVDRVHQLATSGDGPTHHVGMAAEVNEQGEQTLWTTVLSASSVVRK